FNRLAQRAGHGFKACLHLVMVVTALHRKIQRHSETVAQRSEKMRHEFCRQIADRFSYEIAFEFEYRASGQVDGCACKTLVHRQYKTVPPYSTLVPKRLAYRGTDRQC